MRTKIYDPADNKHKWLGGDPLKWKEYHPEIDLKCVEIDCYAGDNIIKHIKHCIEESRRLGIPVVFHANGINLTIDKDTPENLWDDANQCWKYDITELGPKRLSIDPEYKALMDPIIEKRERLYELESKVRSLRDEVDRLTYEVKVRNTSYVVSDQEAYESWRANNTDGYGKAALDYGEALGKLLTIAYCKLEDDQPQVITKSMVEAADRQLYFFGITGFQAGAARSFLKQTWIHADKLTDDALK